jgi:hypothetical protein
MLDRRASACKPAFQFCSSFFVAAAVGRGRDLTVEYRKCFNPISGEELETASLPQDHYPIVVIEEEESSPIRGRQGLL